MRIVIQCSYIFILGHIISFRMPHDAGKRCGIVNMLTKMCGARGVLCALATWLKTALLTLNLRFSYGRVV